MARYASTLSASITNTGSSIKSRIGKLVNSLFFGYYNNPLVFSTKEYTEENLYQITISQETDVETIDGTFNEKAFNLSLKAIPEDLRKPYEMHISGYTEKEISATLGLRKSEVKSRIAYMNNHFSNCFC